MAKSQLPRLSVVVPLYNERAIVERFHASLIAVLKQLSHSWEIVYCDDGSVDGTGSVVAELAADDARIRLLSLSRNFGKELATTAGIAEARGEAIITIDADGQHPVELLPEFVRQWEQGAKVVIGVRTEYRRQGVVKHFGSRLFYRLFNRFTGARLIPGASDYRLIDATVRREFLRLPERNRITRGLIDWLGYDREFIYFKVNPRLGGEAGYSLRKLLKLAIDSVISLTISPLYITAYIGAFVLPVSALLGVGMLINLLLHDPLHLHATGGAYVMVLVLFLIGVLLVSQGIIGLYLSHIHTEAQRRPLYVIDYAKSVGITDAVED